MRLNVSRLDEAQDIGGTGGSSGPDSYGLVAKRYDPSLISDPFAWLGGYVYFFFMPTDSALTVANVMIYLDSAGSGFVADQSKVGIYDLTGVQTAISGDIGSVLTVGGFRKLPIIASVPAGGCYVALMQNSSGGPVILGRTSNLAGSPIPGAIVNAYSGSGFTTALPGSFNPAAPDGRTNSWWMGLTA